MQLLKLSNAHGIHPYFNFRLSYAVILSRLYHGQCEPKSKLTYTIHTPTRVTVYCADSRLQHTLQFQTRYLIAQFSQQTQLSSERLNGAFYGTHEYSHVRSISTQEACYFNVTWELASTCESPWTLPVIPRGTLWRYKSRNERSQSEVTSLDSVTLQQLNSRYHVNSAECARYQGIS